MVTAGNNHNKYYKMVPKGSSFEVEYGRVGAGSQTRSYPMGLWNRKYNEKIAKGYVDRTDLMLDLIQREKPKVAGGYCEIENCVIAEIVERLQAMATKAVQDNYTISSNHVTMAMVDKAQEVLESLLTCDTVESFNNTLLELYGVIPRKMSNVSSYLAVSRDSFGKIIEREQDLLDVMKGQVYVPPVVKQEDSNQEPDTQTILEAKGLVFEEVDEADITKIKSCLGSCADKFHRAWRVRNQHTQRNFDALVASENIKTKLLWHGSRNENWWSIINQGLVLKHTNAVITGKMFGYGIYFATKARKSLGYTSLSGSYWARGSSASAFMGLYEVAYGTPFDVYSFEHRFSSLNYDGLQKLKPGAHCLHAHEGTMLRNDEIIVYKEAQTTIKYLVELKE